jgi:CheY-like chemotaxis protein
MSSVGAMMSAKRALVVDDSKSARAFLSRILERYEITVDTAESAEGAIDYLTRARPDVIFMDHLMPGMDGFQAVQSIKNNPRTATIPIMMYTSQEGELYLGQARALGAIGVLPKQIKPADVSKVLYDLRLVPDRRNAEQSTFTPISADAVPQPSSDTTVLMPSIGEAASATPVSGIADVHAEPAMAAATQPPPQLTPEVRSLIETTIRGEMADLRRAFAANVEAQSDRILGEVRSLLPDPPLPPAAPIISEPTRDRASALGWFAAAASLLAAIALAALWWNQNQELQALRERVADLQNQVTESASAAQAAALANAAPPAVEDSSTVVTASSTLISDAARTPITELVPYGEVPLSGTRVASVRTLLDRLATEGFRGIVEVTTHAGRFCMTGDSAGSYALATDTTLVSKCEIVGNPYYETLSSAERQSMEFANMAAQFRKASQGAIDVRVSGGDPRATDSAYPAASESLTAGEWNKSAAANNRIDIRLRPNG